MRNYQWEIYKIDQSIREVLDIQEDACLPESDVKDMLDMLKMDKEDLIEQVGLEYKNLEAQVVVLKDEMHSLKDRKEDAEDRMRKLKDILTEWLDGKKFETGKVKVTFRKAEETIIDDFENLSDEFVRIKYEPDKTAIKKAIKEGVKVEGAHIETKKSCTIK